MVNFIDIVSFYVIFFHKIKMKRDRENQKVVFFVVVVVGWCFFFSSNIICCS